MNTEKQLQLKHETEEYISQTLTLFKEFLTLLSITPKEQQQQQTEIDKTKQL